MKYYLTILFLFFFIRIFVHISIFIDIYLDMSKLEDKKRLQIKG